MVDTHIFVCLMLKRQKLSLRQFSKHGIVTESPPWTLYFSFFKALVNMWTFFSIAKKICVGVDKGKALMIWGLRFYFSLCLVKNICISSKHGIFFSFLFFLVAANYFCCLGKSFFKSSFPLILPQKKNKACRWNFLHS